MKYNPDAEIHFKYTCIDSSCDHILVYWRVLPKELPLLARIFCNPWRKIVCTRDKEITYSRLFYFSEYISKIYPLNTVKDIENYLKEEENKLIQNRALAKIKRKMHIY